MTPVAGQVPVAGHLPLFLELFKRKHINCCKIICFVVTSKPLNNLFSDLSHLIEVPKYFLDGISLRNVRVLLVLLNFDSKCTANFSYAPAGIMSAVEELFFWRLQRQRISRLDLHTFL